LVWVWTDPGERDLAGSGNVGRSLWDQGGDATAESGGMSLRPSGHASNPTVIGGCEGRPTRGAADASTPLSPSPPIAGPAGKAGADASSMVDSLTRPSRARNS